MLFGYLTLFTALIISVSAAYYSILGLTAIFASAFWPIVILGSSLEVGKIVSTLWLHKYWDRAEAQYKVYLCTAVAILMLLTSMGVFGFLSKAHTDQSLVSGDAGAKIAIYDEKIKISRDNIDANRRALKQMDEAVDQSMARSSDEKGADKAVAIRRGQGAERGRLLKEIEAEQKKITVLNEERAPLAAENRKIEAEVGPIKYIAALIYGDNPETNVLEKSVRWVIILIVIVFDPLALTLLLAATKALEWERGINIFAPKRRDEDEPTFTSPIDNLEPVVDREDPPLDDPEIITPTPAKKEQILSGVDSMWNRAKNLIKRDSEAEHAPIEELVINDGDAAEKEARRAWKAAYPTDTIHRQERLLENGVIDKLPWQPEPLQADNEPGGVQGEVQGFGTQFPNNAKKGDMFLRVDRLPSTLYKFNGANWIEVDKALSDNYAYDAAYIDHLISKIGSGEYDPDLLSDAERDHIETKLRSDPPQV